MTGQPRKPQAIFMMGGPGAGKSFIRNRIYPELTVVDCDQWKERHPDYDPKNPSEVHAWSSEQCARQFFRMLGGSESFVYDGTGSNAEKLVSWMERASEAGFETVVCFVRCPLQTALRRNRERERTVPEHIVREKHAQVNTSFEIAQGYADKTQEIHNG